MNEEKMNLRKNNFDGCKMNETKEVERADKKNEYQTRNTIRENTQRICVKRKKKRKEKHYVFN